MKQLEESRKFFHLLFHAGNYPSMRPSLLQHNVARLRLICGEKQIGFADITKLKLKTLQKIEAKKLPLSEEMARRIATATGVGIKWLLDNDTDAAPVAAAGHTYTKIDFETVQAANGRGEPEFVVQMFPDYLASFYAQMSAILSAAAKEHRAEVVIWKLGKLLAEMREEYGHDTSLMPGEPFATRADGSLALRRAQAEAGWKLMREQLAARDRHEAEVSAFIASAKVKDGGIDPDEPAEWTCKLSKSPRRPRKRTGIKSREGQVSKPSPQSSPRPL